MSGIDAIMRRVSEQAGEFRIGDETIDGAIRTKSEILRIMSQRKPGGVIRIEIINMLLKKVRDPNFTIDGQDFDRNLVNLELKTNKINIKFKLEEIDSKIAELEVEILQLKKTRSIEEFKILTFPATQNELARTAATLRNRPGGPVAIVSKLVISQSQALNRAQEDFKVADAAAKDKVVELVRLNAKRIDRIDRLNIRLGAGVYSRDARLEMSQKLIDLIEAEVPRRLAAEALMQLRGGSAPKRRRIGEAVEAQVQQPAAAAAAAAARQEHVGREMN